MANHLRFVSPDMLHWTQSGELMMMVILGGAGTLAGPLLGAAAMVLLETLLAAQTENWQLYLGFILLAVVMLTRGGLAALFGRVGEGAAMTAALELCNLSKRFGGLIATDDGV